MPVLIVPLLSHHLLRAEAPVVQAALVRDVITDAKRLKAHLPEMTAREIDEAVTQGLYRMKRHGVADQCAKGWHIVSGEEELARFYARSVQHRFEEHRAAAE